MRHYQQNKSTLKTLFKGGFLRREKIYALQAFIYKACRASKKVGVKKGCFGLLFT